MRYWIIGLLKVQISQNNSQSLVGYTADDGLLDMHKDSIEVA